LKKAELKESKLPWEKRSGSPGDFQDENEIEFFEEFDD